MPELQRLESLPVHPHPAAPPAGYRLRVDGLVDRPLELSPDELLALPEGALDDEFACLEGWTVPGLHWRGVLLTTVLELAGVRPDARWVQASFDNFSLPLPLDGAQDALLALSLNGSPIPIAHGAPVRLLVPGGECFTSVKWLDHLELLAEPADNSAERIARARLR